VSAKNRDSKMMGRRDFLKMAAAMGATLVGSTLVACAPAAAPTKEAPTSAPAATSAPEATNAPEATTAPEQAGTLEKNAELVFAWWGSPYEKETGEKMLATFTETTGIKTTPMHMPDQYMDKMQAMAAANTLPDVFYLPYSFLTDWAQKSIIKELTPLYEADSEADINKIVPVCRFKVGSKIFGTGACTEPYMMFYNKKVFDDAQVPYPPAKVEEAWTWDKFIEVCQQLTVDESGKHPNESGFDPTKVKIFAVDVIRWSNNYWTYGPGLWQEGSDVYSEDMNTLFPQQDKAADVIQKIADTYCKYYVSPSPEYYGQSGMSTIQMMQTGKLAMQCIGNWALEEISHSKFSYGEAVIPKMGDSYVIFGRSDAIGMSNKTKYPNAAWQLHKYVTFGEGSLALCKTGLWQPQRIDLLTTDEGRKKWMTEGVHTPEHVTAACLPAVNNARDVPPRTGMDEWQTKYLAPALDPVFLGKKSAADALNEVVPKINQFLKDNPTWLP